MNSVEQVLAILEGDETQKMEQVKTKLHVQSERNARVILHLLETSPDKYQQKITKETHKLEEKLDKEYRKLNRKINSYGNEASVSQHKVAELKYELAELQQLL
jgi:hypothetical protein